MGKRGLYPLLGTKKVNSFSRNLMNFLQYADGQNDLKNISSLIKLTTYKTNKIFKILLKKKLISV